MLLSLSNSARPARERFFRAIVSTVPFAPISINAKSVQNPNIARHPHRLKPIPVAGQQTELTEAQRKERQRSIQLHMTLLQHAATCHSPKCPSANCTKMKGLLKHGAQCKIKATGGCNVCKRIWALLQIHARQCKASQCPVPNCMAIRERVRQLKKQQQAMDDRRRQEMNLSIEVRDNVRPVNFEGIMS